MSLLISLRSEILKTKRTASFYMTIGAAAFGPLMSMLELLLDGIEPGEGDALFNDMLTVKFQMTGFVMLPFFLILLCTLLPQIEYRNNAWKQVLTSPQAKGNIFLAKFINVQLLIITFLLINTLMMFINVVIMHFKEPSLDILSQPVNGHQVLMTVVSGYLSILAISAVQFWLGLRFRNFIIPIAIGIACWFIGTMLVLQSTSELAGFFPYSFHVYGKHPEYRPEANVVGLTSFIYAIVFLVLGFLDFRRRRMSA